MTRVIYDRIGLGGLVSGADFSCVASWEACQQVGYPDHFYVGIVRGNLSLHWEDELRSVPFFANDFLLIHTSGEIITWKYDGKQQASHPALEAALEIDSTETDWDNEVCHQSISNLLRFHMIRVSSEDFSEYVDETFEEKLKIIVPSFEIINANAIAWLAEHPDHLHELHWRKFEELLEALFKDQGFETELGPGCGDGGVDLRLVQRSDIGDLMFLVQAKRYAPHRKICLEPVQALYGSVVGERANKGIFVSTAEFLPGVKDFAQRNRYQLELAGPDRVLEWIRKYGRH